jgi:Cu-Zn family superoxide dismutase
MRITTGLFIGTLLFVAACGTGSDELTTIESAPTVAEDTVVEDTVVEDTVAEDPVTIITETADLSATDSLTDMEDLIETSVVTETAAMTATGEMTAPMAVTTLIDVAGNPVGDASFTETEEGVLIQVTLREFTVAAEGEHGIHIHATGACTPDFQAAGDHFNPTDAQHGLENPAGPHAGDLPNIVVDADGNAIYETTSTLITLGDGAGSLFDADGSALVLHAGADDLVTDPAGDSGDRLACGVIEMQ